MIKIMVVDDEKMTCDHLARMLSRKSYETITAYDGKAAVELFHENRPGIVFLDLHLPEMNGTQVFDEIVRHDSNVKIFFMSGSQDEIQKLQHMKIPAAGFMLKPIMIADIFKLLETLS